MGFFIKTGFWKKARKPLEGELNLSEVISQDALLKTNNLSDISSASTARTNLGVVAIANTSTALTDGATIAVTGEKHTLTTTQSTITFTDTFTGDVSIIRVLFNQTDAVWTFPAGSLGYVGGVASGDNTITISGATSGDKIILGRYKEGSEYYWNAVNFGQ